MVWEAQRLLGVWTAFFHFSSLCTSPTARRTPHCIPASPPKVLRPNKSSTSTRYEIPWERSLMPQFLFLLLFFFFSQFLLIFLCFHVWRYFACTYVCALLVCLVPPEAGRRNWILLELQLGFTMWPQRTEAGFSEREATAHKWRTIFSSS